MGCAQAKNCFARKVKSSINTAMQAGCSLIETTKQAICSLIETTEQAVKAFCDKIESLFKGCPFSRQISFEKEAFLVYVHREGKLEYYTEILLNNHHLLHIRLKDSDQVPLTVDLAVPGDSKKWQIAIGKKRRPWNPGFDFVKTSKYTWNMAQVLDRLVIVVDNREQFLCQGHVLRMFRGFFQEEPIQLSKFFPGMAGVEQAKQFCREKDVTLDLSDRED
eukprot:m.48352 g.48352  ORF g.48352 m.48352 type:complete len:220 (-) comp17783_c0_seq2:111-770(-)